MPKHTLTFEHTITEQLTCEVDLPEGSPATEKDMQMWGRYGSSGMSPFDHSPDQFKQRKKIVDTQWKLLDADPPLAPEPEASRPRKRRKEPTV
jgi:hypothetical protein